MAEETLTAPPVQTPVEAPPPIDTSPAPNTAPDLDGELDNALEKAFSSKEPTNEKDNGAKKPSGDTKETTAQVDKGDVKSEAKPKADPLPDPNSIADAPSKSGKAREGWDALKNNYKTAHRLTQEQEKQILELKKQVAEKVQGGSKEAEALRKEIAELSKYRAMVDIQADPDFISKYDEPIGKTKDGIKTLLKSLDVSDAVISQIDFTNTRLMDEIVNHVGEHRDKFTSRKLQRKIEDLMDLSDKRNETLAEQKENYQKTLEERKKQTFSKGAEEEGRMHKHLDTITGAKSEDGKPLFVFLNRMDIPEGANADQVRQAESHNGLVDVMEKKVQEVLKMNLPEQRAEVAVAAVASHYLNAQLKHAQSKIKSLEDEIKKISNVTDETPKTKARSANGNGQFAPKKAMDTDEALAEFFNR